MARIVAKNAGLPWECILSSELIMTYKPEYRVYQMAADLLGLPASQVMMVSAHKKYDLPPARTIGMRTAFTPRSEKWGAEGKGDYANESWIDIYANDFLELATKLGT